MDMRTETNEHKCKYRYIKIFSKMQYETQNYF